MTVDLDNLDVRMVMAAFLKINNVMDSHSVMMGVMN